MNSIDYENASTKSEIISILPKDVANMSQDKVNRLILMRAENKSLSSIAKELHIAKSTVCNAVKYYENEISTEMYNIAEELKEKFKITSERKLAKYMNLLDKAYEEFEKRDYKFSEMDNKELESMIAHLESKIESITKNFHVITDVKIEGEDPLTVFPDNTQIKVMNFKL